MIKYLINLILILFLFSCNELDLNNVSDVVENSTNKIEEIIERKMKEAEEAKAAEEAANSGPQKKEAPEVEKFITTYYEFPGNFTTNLRGSRKFLQAGIGVSTQYDENVITNVEDHQLSLRSSILYPII